MMKLRLRTGTTLLEVMLFLGILGIMSSTIVGVLITTQQSRVRQSAVSSVDQAGAELLGAMTRTIRRAEKIISPASGATGSILTLQMALNAEYPTMLAKQGSGMTIVQKTGTSALLDSKVSVSDVSFRNVGGSNVYFSFTISTIIRIIPPATYSRKFNGTVTLFPDDQSEAGGCGTCAAPTCTNHRYIWNHCENGTCSPSDNTIPC